MRGAQTDEQMNVILDTPNRFRYAPQILNDATHICVQTASPIFLHESRTIFGTED
jgi:hypothetical protein